MNKSEWLAVGKDTVNELIKIAEDAEAAVAATLRVQRDALIADIEAGVVMTPERARISIESLVHSAGSAALTAARRVEGVGNKMLEGLISNAMTVAKAALMAAL